MRKPGEGCAIKTIELCGGDIYKPKMNLSADHKKATSCQCVTKRNELRHADAIVAVQSTFGINLEKSHKRARVPFESGIESGKMSPWVFESESTIQRFPTCLCGDDISAPVPVPTE